MCTSNLIVLPDQDISNIHSLQLYMEVLGASFK